MRGASGVMRPRSRPASPQRRRCRPSFRASLQIPVGLPDIAVAQIGRERHEVAGDVTRARPAHCSSARVAKVWRRSWMRGRRGRPGAISPPFRSSGRCIHRAQGRAARSRTDQEQIFSDFPPDAFVCRGTPQRLDDGRVQRNEPALGELRLADVQDAVGPQSSSRRGDRLGDAQAGRRDEPEHRRRGARGAAGSAAADGDSPAASRMRAISPGG